MLHLVSSLATGGMEHFVLRLAAWQRERGMDAGILACRDGGLREEAERRGIPTVVLPVGRLGRLTGLMAAVRERRPQILHPHNQPVMPYAALARLASPARVVLTFHGQGSAGIRPLQWWEERLTDHIVAVSGGAYQRLLESRVAASERLRSRITTIQNGVRAEAPQRSRAEVRKELGLREEVLVTIVARVDGRKGHDTLLRALARLKELPVRAAVVGEGAACPELEALARELGLLPERVRFLGGRSDVPDLLAASDLFALPSLSEGLPLSVLEAMAAGLPVAATSVGGLPELIPDAEHGRLFPVNDDAALAEALRAWVVDPAARKRVGEMARERVRRHFSFDAMGEAYMRLYSELLQGRSEASSPALSATAPVIEPAACPRPPGR